MKTNKIKLFAILFLIFPFVASGTTMTFSPSLDGRVANAGVSTNWATTRDAASGNDANYTGDGSTISMVVTGRNGGTGEYNIQRGYFLFDTSALPDDATISAVYLDLYFWDKLNGDNDGNDFFVVTTSSPASTSSLVTGDFSKIGSVEISDRIDISSISIPAYTRFTINATNTSVVDVAGVSKFGVREGHDLLNSAYDGSFGTWNLTNGYFSERTGTSTDPVLTVEYTVPEASSRKLKGIGITR